MSRMSKWYGFDFEQSDECETGYDRKSFNRFSQDFKKEINSQLKDIGGEVHVFSKNHFSLSGFIKKDEKLIYFSIDDVRNYNLFDKETIILIRTAKHDKDYTGGSNSYTNFDAFRKDVENLFTRGW